MSFDLSVWHEPAPITADAARAKLARWDEGDADTGFSVEGWNSNGTAMRVSYEKPGRGTYTPAVNDAGLLARVCTWYLYFCSPMW